MKVPSILLLAFFFIGMKTYAQNQTFAIGTTTPNLNAALHVESPTNNQGFIMPRLTTAQRTASAFQGILSSADAGLMLYDKDLKNIFVWNGSIWATPYKPKYSITDPNSFDTVLTAKTYSNKPHSFAVSGIHKGTGDAAGFFMIDNAASAASALYSQTNGTGPATSAWNFGTGVAGSFISNNPASIQPGIYAQTDGAGAAGMFYTWGTGPGLFVNAYGPGGSGGRFSVLDANNSSECIFAQTYGTGSAGSFIIDNASSAATGVYAATNGSGSSMIATTSTGWAAFSAVRDGATNGFAGSFQTTNSANSWPTLYALSQSATNEAGLFDMNNVNNTASAIYGRTKGTGNALTLDHIGASGNIALFKSGSVSQARIDKTGKGFFNGGTQSSGADVAEMFDVEGAKENYEPGDVLVISETTDRTIEKSTRANATTVVGVYATKPGVILTEKSSEENTDQLVPLGVIGVIPTKVCGENGPIKRGDLIVTSSISGHAMKAVSEKGDGVYAAGTILGKALENFDGNGRGMILVLVNVK